MAYREECAKCNGKGEIKAFSGIAGGICFCCNGKGYVVLKSKRVKAAKFGVFAKLVETGHIVGPICYIKEKNDDAAIEMARFQLSKGNAYDPMSVSVEAMQ